MAYTLTDQFRPLRMIMRINGLMIGIVLGLLLLILSKATLTSWGLYTTGLLWPMRLAGALLCALGVLLVLAAAQRMIDTLILLPMMIAHGLMAFVMLLAYFQQELRDVTLGGRLLFILIFFLCLVGVITPLRYLRAEYRM